MLQAHGPPLLFALFAWWFSTGAIFWLNGRAHGGENRTSHVGLLAMTGICALALFGVALTARDSSAAGAYLAFVCALGVWGWHELAFLSGAVTGPRTEPCPPGATGWLRFRLAAATVIYHEAGLALGGCLVAVLAWNQPNQAAPLAYGVLFVMRLSAKLNLFLGVPNFSDEFMPGRLSYLKSYFRRRKLSAAFPVSMAVGLLIAAGCARVALTAEPGGATQVGATLAFALVSLALVEHVFMVAPFRDSVLWRWAFAAPQLDHDPGRTE